jgi:cytochrome c553
MKALFKHLLLSALLLGSAYSYAGNATNGEALATKLACAACHGAGLNKPIDPSYPKIAGQYEDYIYVALKSYKVENNALVGRNHPSMVGIVKQLKLEELRDLAAYVSQLPGELQVAAQPKIRYGQK